MCLLNEIILFVQNKISMNFWCSSYSTEWTRAFTRVLIPFMWALPHDLIIFQWSHFLKSLLWGLGFQHMNFGRTQAFGPNEETDLSKVTQCLIHTECSIVLIGSQGLRKLNQDQRPQVEGLRWQTPWCISQQYMCISSVFLGYQSLSNPLLLLMFLFEIWVYYWVLRQSKIWPTW